VGRCRFYGRPARKRIALSVLPVQRHRLVWLHIGNRFFSLELRKRTYPRRRRSFRNWREPNVESSRKFFPRKRADADRSCSDGDATFFQIQFRQFRKRRAWLTYLVLLLYTNNVDFDAFFIASGFILYLNRSRRVTRVRHS